MDIKQKQKFNIDLAEILVSLTLVLSVASGFLWLGGIRPASTLASALEVNKSKVEAYNDINLSSVLDVKLINFNDYDALECSYDREGIIEQNKADSLKIANIEEAKGKYVEETEESLENLPYLDNYINLSNETAELLNAKKILLEKKTGYNDFVANLMESLEQKCREGFVLGGAVDNLLNSIESSGDLYGLSAEKFAEIKINTDLLWKKENIDILVNYRFDSEEYKIDEQIEVAMTTLDQLNTTEIQKYSNDFRINKNLVFLD